MRERLAGAAPVVAGYALLLVALWAAWMRYEPVRVTGGSMRPALVAGDVVVVEREAAVGEGDIALVREPGHDAVLHRVVRLQPDGSVMLKGDANDIGDFSPVPARDIAGRVVRVLPLGRLIDRWRRDSPVRYTGCSIEHSAMTETASTRDAAGQGRAPRL